MGGRRLALKWWDMGSMPREQVGVESTMKPRGAASSCLVVVVIVVCVAGTRAPSGDQGTTTSRDGCRMQPTDDCLGMNVDCSGLRLGFIPNDLPADMRKLTMRRNNITRLDDHAFEKYTQLTSLDLSRNELRALGVHAFSGLSRLQQLDLTYNELCMNTSTYPVGLFSGMTSLRRLTMTSNVCKTQHTKYPDETLAHLPNLEFLSITGTPTSRLGEGFGRLTNLKTLVFAGHGCKMPAVSNMTFHNLRNVNLSHLCIKACRLETMEVGALKPLSHLKTLNLACNQEVGFPSVHAAVLAAKDTELTTLVVDDVTPSGLILNKDDFTNTALTGIERMSIRANDIVEVDISLLRPLKRLTHFNLVDFSDYFSNRSTYRRRYCFREAKPEEEDPADPTEYFFRERPPFADLDYSRPRLPTKVCGRGSGRTHREEKECLTIPPSVQIIYADNSKYKRKESKLTARINVSADNDVVVLNASYNPFTAVGPIRGLRRCQVVDLRHCAIETIVPGALSDMRMLKYLFLMDNNIGRSNTNLKGMFDGLSSLEVLDLSRNGIFRIDISAFSSLTNLSILSLRGNHLTSVSFDINGLRRLATINLADNNISHLDVKSLTKATSDNICIYIDLDSNPVNISNPFHCNEDIVMPHTANCPKDTTTQDPGTTTQHPADDRNDTTTQPQPSDTNDKPRSNKTLLTSLIIIATVTAMIIAVVVVIATNKRRRTNFLDCLRNISRTNRYRRVDHDLEM
ncbi:hypothetical protein LSAT2_012291 [Lamellibrachia satsuma]|nr:hypothetical protein LSAT2_012291 [Lamellibrachia satsuma]